MFDETEHAWQRVFNCVRAFFINFASETDRIRDIAPDGRAGFFKFAEQKSFLGAIWKEHVDRFEMCAGHGENMGGAVNEIGRERLAAQIADVYAICFANLHRVKARRLSADGMHTGGSDFDVLAIPDQPAKQSFRDRTAADVAGANKKDAFHDFASRLRTRR